jgi:D-3-phosphoglycerate dehydrogenase
VEARVIVTEKISEEGMNVLAASVHPEAAFDIDRETLLTRIADFDGMIVRSSTQVDRELLERGTRLRVVGRAGVGVDNIDIPSATSRGVVVVNAPESNIVSAAEHTMALILALARNIPIVNDELKAGAWTKAARQGVELYGKTLGIVGLGRVGSAVAVRASSFGMKVISYDPYIAPERFGRFGTTRVESLDALLARSDYVSVHTPKTDETYGMIGDRELGLTRDGVRIINTARGGIVAEDALVRALESGKVAGAGLDVFEGEPVNSHPLFGLEQVVVSPHLGGSTEEAQVRVGVSVAEQVIEALEGKLPSFALNVPLMDVEGLSFVQPFLPLAELLGDLFTQVFGLPMEEAEIRYGGEIGRYSTELLTAAFLKGLLRTVAGDRVNLVNARVVAEATGLAVGESRSADADRFTSLLTVRGKNAGEHRLAGTLVAEGSPRIVEIDGFEVDLPPVGDIVVCWHAGSAVGRPGIVGRVGTSLGDAGVNISRMEVGRQIINDRAIMVISPDGDMPGRALEVLSAMPELVKVKLARLGRGTATRGRNGF